MNKVQNILLKYSKGKMFIILYMFVYYMSKVIICKKMELFYMFVGRVCVFSLSIAAGWRVGPATLRNISIHFQARIFTIKYLVLVRLFTFVCHIIALFLVTLYLILWIVLKYTKIYGTMCRWAVGACAFNDRCFC